MGDGVTIDPDAVSSVAAGLSESADAIAASATAVNALRFGPAAAGRSYMDLGVRFAEGYRRIDQVVSAWSSAGHDVADALDGAVAGYRNGDDAAAGSLGRAEGGTR